MLEEARFSPDAAGVELRAAIDPRLAAHRVGQRQGLRQVLTNLVGNAVKFTEAGSVSVSARESAEGTVRIEVQDTGIGIPAAAQEKIFQPFEQADASMTRRYRGTGLGLAISAEVVARMGGSIGVVSTEGAGSLFWIELPLATAHSPSPPPTLAVEA